MAAFSRYIVIDYSGAETPESSLEGLCVYCAVGESAATEVPPPSPRKYWTRRGIASSWPSGSRKTSRRSSASIIIAAELAKFLGVNEAVPESDRW